MSHIIMLVISLGLGFAFNYLFFGKAVGVSWIVFVGLVLIGLGLLCWRHRVKPPRLAWILMVPLLFFSAMVFVRASHFLTFLNVVFSLYLLLLIARTVHGDRLHHFVILDYLSTFFIEPLGFIFRSFPRLLKGVVSLRVGGERRFFSSPVFKGILMALPVIAVMALLFASADLIFQKYLRDIFSIEISVQLLQRTFFIALVTILFGGAYAYIFAPRVETPNVVDDSKKASVGQRETAVFLGALNIFFLTFVIIQLRYLFGGSEWITVQGFTYAEYARKGFFELLAASALTFLIIFFAEKAVYRSGDTHARSFQVLSSALVAQVLIVMSSSFKRLLMYEGAYGFTLSRFYAHIILIFLAVVFLLFLYKMWIRRSEAQFAGLGLITLAVFLAGVNVMSPDVFVARQNVARFLQNPSERPLDAWYLSSLSDDAVPELIDAFDNPAITQNTHEELGNNLYHWSQNRYSSPERYSTWVSWQISRVRAQRMLYNRVSELEKYKEYTPVEHLLQ